MLKLQQLKEPMAKAHGMQYLKIGDRMLKITIGDIPVLQSDDKKIVCFPKEKMEAIKIGIFGLTGSGKTMAGNAILGRLYHYWNISCNVFNDYLDETKSWALRNTDFERELRVLNETPFPLPIAHVYPQNRDTEVTCGLKVPHIRETVSFSKIVECLERYIELKPNTLKYLLTIREDLKKCENFEELEEQISQIGSGKKGVNVEGSKFAMLSALDDLKKEGYVDIVANNMKFEYSGTPSSMIKIKSREGTEEGTIFSMLMKYGYIPSLQTSNLLHLRYAEPYLVDKLRDIFEYPRMYKKNCVTYIPEMKLLMKYPQVVKEIENITARGRLRGVGLIYDTQHYTSIKKEIITNTLYALAFNQKEATANQIKKDFDLNERDKTQIINLKKHQCLAICSSGESWSVYDLKTGEKSMVSGCFRGYPIYPLSSHKKGKSNVL